MSQMANAMAWLAGQKKTWDSVPATYSRGSVSGTIQVTLGSVVLKTQDGRGNVKVERTDRDAVFTAADLTAIGISLPPQREDMLTLTVGTMAEKFIVLPYGPAEPMWRWVDAHETMVRLHLKYQGPA